jgi:hypothetical protein
VDWNAIRQEYITDETSSYRSLSKKYGIGLTQLSKHAKDEDWIGQRAQLKDKTMTKTIEKLSEQQAKRALNFVNMTDTLAEKLMAALEKVDPKDTQSLRRIAASLHDLAEMQGLKSDLDRQEQEARIANLRKQADKEDDTATKEVNVTFIGDIEEYSK